MSDYTELIQELRHYFDGVPLVLKAADAIERLTKAVANYAEQAEELQAAVEGYEANTDVQFVEHGTYSELKFVPKWIPVTERLPQEEKEYWCFCRGGAWKQLSWMDRYFWNGERFEFPWGGEYDEVTHWMPLPTPPKEGEE